MESRYELEPMKSTRNKIKTWSLALTLVFGVLLVWSSCKTRYFKGQYKTASELIHLVEGDTTPIYLKVHHKNGDVSILGENWFIDTSLNRVYGHGERYDVRRNLVEMGAQDISIDSVVLFETNKKLNRTEGGRIAAVTIVAAADAVMAVYCITDPKACWGSCPTFYIHPDEDLHHSDAEGFSSAILPSLEYRDIDDLNYWEANDKFQLTMKNEALETHVVREVELLAIPAREDQVVLHGSDDHFYLSDRTFSPVSAQAEEGDILHHLSAFDRQERSSLADSHDILTKEEIFIEFDNGSVGQIGLDMSFRHSLMSTYLFYSFIGYMGHQASDIFSLMETDPYYMDRFKKGVEEELGGIDVYQWSENLEDWIFVESVAETGPIAVNRQLIQLPSNNKKAKVKLVMTKGMWRLDHVQLASIAMQVEAKRLAVSSVFAGGKRDPAAETALQEGGESLVTFPGDVYTLNFDLPQEGCQLFLASKGYYMEWLRKEWFEEENAAKLFQLTYRPRAYLKNEAPFFKAYEAIMEQQFWQSRIKNQILSYEE